MRLSNGSRRGTFEGEHMSENLAKLKTAFAEGLRVHEEDVEWVPLNPAASPNGTPSPT